MSANILCIYNMRKRFRNYSLLNNVIVCLGFIFDRYFF
jgi:hypothetical protein